MHFIIIGTDHGLQDIRSRDRGLQSLLRAKLTEGTVVLIAEEIKTSIKVTTFGMQLIGEDKWLSIDMNAQERQGAGLDAIPRQQGPGYDSATGDEIVVNRYQISIESPRENFWLDKIFAWLSARSIETGTVIITCGHNHLLFLREKIESRGHTVSQDEYLPYDKEAKHGKFQICD